MLIKLKNKKSIIIAGIVIIVIAIGIGVYLFKENHDSVVMNTIMNFEEELSKNSMIVDEEYSEQDLEKLKSELEKVLKDVEGKKPTMEILWSDYSQYDKLVESIKTEVKAIDEKIVSVKKIAEQKAKEEAEKKVEEERIAKEEEERKAQEVETNNNTQQSTESNSNNTINSSNSNSGNSSDNTGSGSKLPWNYGYGKSTGSSGEITWVNEQTGDVYDNNGNWLFNLANPLG